MTREQLDALKVDLSDYANWAPTTRILVLQMFEEYASQRALIEQQAKEIARLRDTLERISRHVPIMGSTGDYRQGQLDVLESVKRIAEEHP